MALPTLYGLIALVLLLSLATWSTADYPCYENHDGRCYDCPHQYKICHRASSHVIYYNAKIYSVDPDKPYWHTTPFESMVVKNGKITFLGNYEESKMQKIPGKTRMVDLGGSTVLPGFHDVHMHPLEARSEVGGTCALPRDTPPDDASLSDVFTKEKCHLKQKGTEWVLGHGHSISALLDYIKRTNTNPIDLLDEWVVDNQGNALPALIMEETSHSFWVNSEALRRAGITKDVQNRDGMVYMRDGQGNFTGIILENAGIAIMEYAMDPVKYPKLADLNYEGLLNGLYELAMHGITSAVDARCYWTRNHHKAWEKAQSEGLLTAKVILSMWAHPEKSDEEQIPILKSFFDNNKDSRLRKSQVKVYMDGLINTRTARVLQAYGYPEPDLEIGDYGLNYFNSSRLASYMRQLQDISTTHSGEGYDFIVHTIGDAAVREMLDAVEASRSDDLTPKAVHKATHIEMVSPEDYWRFSHLGVIADGQVAGDFTFPFGPDHNHRVDLIGRKLANNFIPIRSLLENDAVVTLSSDWDVSDLNPFVGLANAISRGRQQVTIKEAIEMYTARAAYSMRHLERTGSLSFHKDADFIVLDRDVVELGEQGNYDAIAYTTVLMTVLEGDEVWVL